MQPKRELTLVGELLRTALASTEHAVEAARSAVAVARRECLSSVAQGASVDEVAVCLGVSMRFAEVLTAQAMVEPIELVGLVSAARLRLVMELQQNPAWTTSGLVGCTTNASGLTMLWHQPDTAARHLIDFRARELGVAVTHEDFPASRAAVDQVVGSLAARVGFSAIRDARLLPSGVLIRVDATVALSLRDLQAETPAWVDLRLA